MVNRNNTKDEESILTGIFLDTLINRLGIPKSYIKDADPVEYAKTDTMMYNRGIYGK